MKQILLIELPIAYPAFNYTGTASNRPPTIAELLPDKGNRQLGGVLTIRIFEWETIFANKRNNRRARMELKRSNFYFNVAINSDLFRIPRECIAGVANLIRNACFYFLHSINLCLTIYWPSVLQLQNTAISYPFRCLRQFGELFGINDVCIQDLSRPSTNRLLMFASAVARYIQFQEQALKEELDRWNAVAEKGEQVKLRKAEVGNYLSFCLLVIRKRSWVRLALLQVFNAALPKGAPVSNEFALSCLQRDHVREMARQTYEQAAEHDAERQAQEQTIEHYESAMRALHERYREQQDLCNAATERFSSFEASIDVRSEKDLRYGWPWNRVVFIRRPSF